MVHPSSRLTDETDACTASLLELIDTAELAEQSDSASCNSKAAESLLLTVLHGVASPSSQRAAGQLALGVLPVVLALSASRDQDLVAEAQVRSQ